MSWSVERVEGRVMAVNSFLVHGPAGVVVVDGMLTIADANLVRDALAASGAPLAGVLVTHPHPDHYAGIAQFVDDDQVPIVATRSVDAVIRRDDQIKDAIVGPMMGPEWPRHRLFPNQLVDDGADVTLGGVTLRVEELGVGESHADTLWWLNDETVFAGDVAYNGMHAYLADAHWADWTATLARLEARLAPTTTMLVGHGPPCGLPALGAQRRYIEVFVEVVAANADALADGDHTAVVSAMQALLPAEDLLFLMDLSIEPVLAAWLATNDRMRS